MGHSLFFLLLLSSSEIACFAQCSFALPLRLGWHTLVQAASVALVAGRAEALCACSAMRQQPSREAMGALAAAFNWVSAFMQPLGALAAAPAAGGNATLAAAAEGGLQPAAAAAEGLPECWAVVVLLEVMLGESLNTGAQAWPMLLEYRYTVGSMRAALLAGVAGGLPLLAGAFAACLLGCAIMRCPRPQPWLALIAAVAPRPSSLGAGFVVPTVMAAVWECRAFKEFEAAGRGRRRSDTPLALLYRHTRPGVLGGTQRWDWLEAAKLGLASLTLFGGVWGGLRVYAARRAFAPLAAA